MIWYVLVKDEHVVGIILDITKDIFLFEFVYVEDIEEVFCLTTEVKPELLFVEERKDLGLLARAVTVIKRKIFLVKIDTTIWGLSVTRERGGGACSFRRLLERMGQLSGQPQQKPSTSAFLSYVRLVSCARSCVERDPSPAGGQQHTHAHADGHL